MLGDDELDLFEFQRLRELGRPAEALSIWRGAPLSELGYQRFAQAEIARLEDLRLVCLEERIEQDLGAGRHAELTGELERVVKEHPLRERLRGQLMLALYRSGRQAEALDAYQQTRAALVEDLGIEPSRSSGNFTRRSSTRTRRSIARCPRPPIRNPHTGRSLAADGSLPSCWMGSTMPSPAAAGCFCSSVSPASARVVSPTS